MDATETDGLGAIVDPATPVVELQSPTSARVCDIRVVNGASFLGHISESSRSLRSRRPEYASGFHYGHFDDWLKKPTAVSDEDFSKNPTRNRLAVFLNRTNHASFHTGQIALTK